MTLTSDPLSLGFADPASRCGSVTARLWHATGMPFTPAPPLRYLGHQGEPFWEKGEALGVCCLEQQREPFLVTFFGLSKKVTKETRFRRQGQSPLRRRWGVHGHSGSHVGAAGDWQRLQLPGPLTLCAQNRSLLQQFDSAPQTTTVMQAGASTPLGTGKPPL